MRRAAKIAVARPAAPAPTTATSIVSDVQLGKQPTERGHFGGVVDQDVRVVGVSRRVVLVILLGPVERLQRLQLRRDLALEDALLVELTDVGLGEAPLLRIGEEDRRAVLASDVGPLPVDLRRV